MCLCLGVASAPHGGFNAGASRLGRANRKSDGREVAPVRTAHRFPLSDWQTILQCPLPQTADIVPQEGNHTIRNIIQPPRRPRYCCGSEIDLCRGRCLDRGQGAAAAASYPCCDGRGDEDDEEEELRDFFLGGGGVRFVRGISFFFSETFLENV